MTPATEMTVTTPRAVAPPPADDIAVRAAEAAAFLKALSHEGRLMILCHLAQGERSVTELETLLEQRQSAVSQQLARLRLEGLVTCRREGKTIYYAIRDPKVGRIITTLHDMFCNDSDC
ncbi:MAG: helix-turn-helix transcriptional regulator [Paracoccaceae bacterium]|nr:MAG: helix-turn-helix transcriptional regulator [Paracoccaceae bacterium]